MGRIEYRKGDMLADPTPGVLLLHACNSQGVWGRGIAAQFKTKYPRAFEAYNRHCIQNNKDLAGRVFAVGDGSGNPIICAFTSNDYAAGLSSPEVITENTKSCLAQMRSLIKNGAEIWSPKINSGLFKTPWENTEALIEEYLLDNPETTWVVWEF